MVARQSPGPMKTNHAWIADSHTMALHGHGVELWGYFWSFPFRSDANEVFDANYEDANLKEDSDENPLRPKVCVTLRMKQDSKSPCSSKAAASRENHPGNWIQSGTVTASI